MSVSLLLIAPDIKHIHNYLKKVSDFEIHSFKSAQPKDKNAIECKVPMVPMIFEIFGIQIIRVMTKDYKIIDYYSFWCFAKVKYCNIRGGEGRVLICTHGAQIMIIEIHCKYFRIFVHFILYF